ncbi:MAG: NUDIX hydrolase, partial [Clostridia bacterium]|nr:NUDIX hydrolase [Clostridia bacterium]
MKFKSLQKVHAGKFIDRYDIVYETADGNDKVYEMISRDHDIDKADDPFARLTRPHNDSVILVVTDESGERLLISKEFRMACGHWVYNFVAGLIDPGESPEESAKRELWEET